MAFIAGFSKVIKHESYYRYQSSCNSSSNWVKTHQITNTIVLKRCIVGPFSALWGHFLHCSSYSYHKHANTNHFLCRITSHLHRIVPENRRLAARMRCSINTSRSCASCCCSCTMPCCRTCRWLKQEACIGHYMRQLHAYQHV